MLWYELYYFLSLGNDQESPQVASDREMDGGDGAQGGNAGEEHGTQEEESEESEEE